MRMASVFVSLLCLLVVFWTGNQLNVGLCLVCTAGVAGIIVIWATLIVVSWVLWAMFFEKFQVSCDQCKWLFGLCHACIGQICHAQKQYQGIHFLSVHTSAQLGSAFWRQVQQAVHSTEGCPKAYLTGITLMSDFFIEVIIFEDRVMCE